MKPVKNGDVLDFDKPSMVVSCCRCKMKHTIQLDEVDGRPVLRYFLWHEVPAKSDNSNRLESPVKDKEE